MTADPFADVWDIPEGGDATRLVRSATDSVADDLSGNTYTCYWYVRDTVGDTVSTLATISGVIGNGAGTNDQVTLTATTDDVAAAVAQLPSTAITGAPIEVGTWELWEADGTDTRPICGGPLRVRPTHG